METARSRVRRWRRPDRPVSSFLVAGPYDPGGAPAIETTVLAAGGNSRTACFGLIFVFCMRPYCRTTSTSTSWIGLRTMSSRPDRGIASTRGMQQQGSNYGPGKVKTNSLLRGIPHGRCNTGSICTEPAE
ncbi:uncharacterized protein [Triticum aestivum]|uniref:uncharacterized protein isoform X2 n=1 Tax=Triticum aestivum TaxID=4565 RepID=UPI001D0332A6|nr:uncharacterized protein LOC123156011 isoform X2 [Triticum aestivum]